jgi:HEAT repeat protein
MADLIDDMIDLQALAKANDPRAVAAVEPLLGDNLRVEDKRTVVRRLRRLRGRAVEDTLSVIAERDSSPEIRVKAAAALRRSDHGRALPYLLTGLSAEDAADREHAIRALERDDARGSGSNTQAARRPGTERARGGRLGLGYV